MGVKKAVKKNVKKPEKKLTEKEKLFCQIYINNFNATQAYIKAFESKYTTAQVQGYRLLTKPNIKAEIAALKKEKAKSLGLNKNDIVERYMRIAFADMTDFVEWGQEEVPVMTMYGLLKEVNPITGQKEIVTKKVNVVKFKESKMVDGGLVCQIKQGKDGVSIKLEDRQKALEWLANYFEMDPMNQYKKDYDKRKFDIEEEKLAVLKESQKSMEQNDGDRLTDEEIQAKIDEVKRKYKEVE